MTQFPIAPTLPLLVRHYVRKAAREAGFDVLEDMAQAVLCRSSHAPLVCGAWASQAGGFVVSLSMPSVVATLGVAHAAALPSSMPTGLPTMAALFSIPDAPALEQFLNQAWNLSRALPNALEQRFEKAMQEIGATEREATVKQRVGQGLFREGLMTLWGGKCAITGLDVPEMLRASHAKPWADSTDVERLDVFNGMLLAAHWDAAFDAGLVTVEANGTLKASPRLPPRALQILGGPIGLAAIAIKLHPQHAPYLDWHRSEVFKGGVI
ncbi:HNH endonuclease [Acidovorax sp. 99]|uniref:HNH endonuclease n=1 Tax=Acidovorax sp. 99 TaxID=2135634 RepID=UPI000D5D38ED|nr:HNH endonuclease [Acidovorax sp. 99]PVY89437.1 HNH endonuclease [Acidovorax sp. 99]